MAEGDIPDFEIFFPYCHYPAEKHIEVARAAKAAFPDIFQWMKENPDGVSEDMPGGREKFMRLNSFIEKCLPSAQSIDFRAVSHLVFMAAAYTPQMMENARILEEMRKSEMQKNKSNK